MATTTNNANVVSKSATTNNATLVASENKSNKTQRVLETRQDWSVIFNHTLSLVVTLAKGETLSDDPRKGFAFGKVAEQPHSRQYAQSLLAGFTSKKAGKVFAQTEGLQTTEERTKIAIAILVATKLGGKDEASAKGLLAKADPKQAKAFAEAVLNEVQKVAVPAEVAPKEQKKSTKPASKKQTKSASK